MCCKHYFFKHYIEIQTNQFDGVIIDYLDSNEINAKVYLPLKNASIYSKIHIMSCTMVIKRKFVSGRCL